MNSYDVIIIGVGSVGTPAALAMARTGLKILVLDKFASEGQGSSKSAIGGVRATHSDPTKIRLGKRSLEILSTWKETYGHDIEWTTGGYSFVAYRKQEEKTLKDLLQIQRAYELNIDWCDKKELLDVIPDLNPIDLVGGTFSPDDGHCSTLLVGHALYEEAKRAGAVFHFNETVEAISVKGGRIQEVRTNRREYPTGVVLNAAGAWAKQLGGMVGLEHPVNPDSHEAGITEPVAHFLDPMVVDIRPAPGSLNYYFYQLSTGQVVFCITPSPSIWGVDRSETSAFLPLISHRIVELMPRLANIRVRRTWRGLYPMTPDGSPLVGWAKEIEGYLTAIGMCGQGLMLGPGLGELLARVVTQDKLSSEDQETLECLSPYRDFSGEEKLK